MDELERLQILYGEGVSLHEKGEYAAAIECYLTIIDRFPDADLAWYNLGLARYQLGRYRDAASAFLAAADVVESEPDYWYNAGLALKKAGAYGEALRCYERALRLAPDDADIAYNLGCCHQAAGAVELAVNAYEQALALDPRHAPALGNLAYCIHRLGNFERATELYGQLRALRPDDPSVHYMLAALRGDQVPDRPPDAYVAGLFDAYADHFDRELVENLSYRVPGLLLDLVRKHGFLSGPDLSIVDLGCGTGLSGQVFAPWKRELIGVDLSPAMVEQARRKGCYDRLEVADVLDFLKDVSWRADLLVAADLLTYLGELKSFFTLAAARIRPGGRLCCSTEHYPGEERWVLQASGRYGHAPDYVERVAARAGLRVADRWHKKIRREGREWVRGDLFLFAAA